MYVFEFTNKNIKIYNKKTKKLIIEPIPSKIIVDNQIYDFVKLNRILSKIVNKYKLINSFFRIKIKIIIFEILSPSNLFLFKNVFNNIANLDVEVVNIAQYFEDNTIFISGNRFYYQERSLKKLNNQYSYYLVGNSEKLDENINYLENIFKIRIFTYENNNTIIYEKV